MNILHDLVHWITTSIGSQIGETPPVWVHPVLHVILIWAPLSLVAFAAFKGVQLIRRRLLKAVVATAPTSAPGGLPQSVFSFILGHSRRDQVALMLIGLASMPIFYVTLELPKNIINNALSQSHETTVVLGETLSQLTHLALLCGAYLLAILINGATKFGLNVYKGAVGERMLRRLRLRIYGGWRAGAGPERRTEIIPLIAQEVEPIGGFSSDAFALPVFQGGTFVTILVFMFVQDPILGAAAITLLPIQLFVIPRMQKRINELSRRRVHQIRRLGGELGDQVGGRSVGDRPVLETSSILKSLEGTRRDLHRAKYAMKAVNNFLAALTPFFFYSIGGYLVIEGRLTLGALVAVLAAYKDFSAPVRELFRYYQTVEDVRIRYREVHRFLSDRSDGTDQSSSAVRSR